MCGGPAKKIKVTVTNHQRLRCRGQLYFWGETRSFTSISYFQVEVQVKLSKTAHFCSGKEKCPWTLLHLLDDVGLAMWYLSHQNWFCFSVEQLIPSFKEIVASVEKYFLAFVHFQLGLF